MRRRKICHAGQWRKREERNALGKMETECLGSGVTGLLVGKLVESFDAFFVAVHPGWGRQVSGTAAGARRFCRRVLNC